MTAISSISFASFGNDRAPETNIGRKIPRREEARPAFRRQPALNEFDFGHGHGFSANAQMIQRISIGDSSDDEIPSPPHLSALTKDTLDERPSTRRRSSGLDRYAGLGHEELARTDSNGSRSRAGTPSRGTIRITRRSPTSFEEAGIVTSTRLVHIANASRSSGLRRSLSRSEKQGLQVTGVEDGRNELTTSAPMSRERPTVRHRHATTLSGNQSMRSDSAALQAEVDSDQVHAGHDLPSFDGSVDRESHSALDSVTRGDAALSAESGSLRSKRPITSGTVRRSGLRGAPMRRPLPRRLSDEDQSPEDEGYNVSKHANEYPPSAEAESDSLRPTQAHISIHDFAEDAQGKRPTPKVHSQDSGYSSLHRESRAYPISGIERALSPDPSLPALVKAQNKATVQPLHDPQVFKMPALPPALPSSHDQENEPPPTFKRNKPHGSGVLGKVEKFNILSDALPPKMLIDTPRAKSPSRHALASLHINTPQRSAPPPPKMTVLETATAAGGASTVKKKKRSNITVNGKIYSLRGRLGKGGSSDVYRVMAENDKMFALKKVNLEDCDEGTVRGYKGEIELLKKLENVERVVRLFDWEVNESKQSLSVLMEIGESDLNRILITRLQPENAVLDLSFTRHYWREMLCCVEAVHAYDIVHSDLKPANFLLVQGRLKLIDFGIAGAIDDNTVNVHRETNVGTPSYMSPESLLDTNANQRATSGSVGALGKKLMKLGKPSDIWSLGCILYQMTYGKAPFAHIQNSWNRVMAIINPSIVISYPELGIGSVLVPSSLMNVLRTCLNRDPSQRPTLSHLLSEKEAFLNPDRIMERWERDGAVPVTEHVLEQILTRIVERCRDPKRGIPTDEDVKVYPKAFLDRVREMQR